jgi:hypothetical protein
MSIGVKREVDIGTSEKYPFRLVLVDINAEHEWEQMSMIEMAKTKALVKLDTGLKISYRYEDRLEDIGIYNGITFHLYAVPGVREQFGQPTFKKICYSGPAIGVIDL